MIKHYNLDELLRQPGARLRSSRSGAETFAVSYQGKTEDAAAAYNLIKLGSDYQQLLPTDPSYTGLSLEDKDLVFDEADIAILNLVWEGYTEEVLPPPFWQIIRTPSEEPIDAHPNFASLIGGTAANPKNGAKFDDETGVFLGFPSGSGTGSNKLDGVSKYLAEKLVVRKEYISLTKPNDNFEIPIIRAPTIDPQDRGLNILPSIPIGWSWLQTDLVYGRRGKIWEVFEEYTASGTNGWNTLIYPTY